MSRPKKYITVSVCEESIYEPLPDFLARVNAVVSSIPEASRDEAYVELSASSFYDSYYPTWSISYERPFTDEEMAESAAEDARRAEEAKIQAKAREAQERTVLAMLKAKYER